MEDVMQELPRVRVGRFEVGRESGRKGDNDRGQHYTWTAGGNNRYVARICKNQLEQQTLNRHPNVIKTSRVEEQVIFLKNLNR